MSSDMSITSTSLPQKNITKSLTTWVKPTVSIGLKYKKTVFSHISHATVKWRWLSRLKHGANLTELEQLHECCVVKKEATVVMLRSPHLLEIGEFTVTEAGEALFNLIRACYNGMLAEL